MSLRSESLKLYRDILRASRMFTWANEAGEPWRDVLRKNARKEFEQARYERDTLVITRLLVVGRDSLKQINEKLVNAAQAVNDNIDKTRTR